MLGDVYRVLNSHLYLNAIYCMISIKLLKTKAAHKSRIFILKHEIHIVLLKKDKYLKQ